MKRVASSEWRAGRQIPLLARYSLLAFLLLFASAALALEVPPAPTEWYTDTTGLLDSSQASALNEKLRAFEQERGVQLIIYAFPSLEGDPLEDFTIRCAGKWKVGNKKYDNGLILFVFKNDRKVRIEVGYGLEGTVTDAFSSRVIRDYIAPHFRTGDYAAGLNAGADALMSKIRGGEEPVPPTSPGATGQGSRPGAEELPGGAFFLLFIIFALVILPRILMRGGRHGCGGCLFPMLFWPGGGSTFGGGGFGGGGFSGGGFGGGGGFSGGGGGFGGGGASGGW